MKTRYVRDLQPNETVTSSFLVQQKEIRVRKTGEPYLTLHLSDCTGQLEARKWEDFEDVVDTFDRDDFVKVQGVVQNYRNRPQMTIVRLRRLDESEIDLADYLPHTTKDIEEMFGALCASIAKTENPALKQLLESFVEDEEIARRLKIAPAAKSLHHAYIGGLLEHIVSLLNLAELVAGNYDFIDGDLVKTGIVLHDLGKIHELTYQRSFGYSSEGQLLGHIVIVLQMIDRKCSEIPEFPPKLKTLIEHMILSHHGRYEFGSPKLPMFPEALLVHYLDDLDSKLESMRASVASDTQQDEVWTRYNPSLERTLLKKDRFLSSEAKDGRGLPMEQAPPGAMAQERPPKPQKGRHPAPEPGGKTMSLFGERLKSAWERDRDKE